MKLTSLLIACFLTTSLFAIEWEVIGQDSNRPVYAGSLQADLKKNLGDLTVKIFDSEKIPYVGNEAGMNSILGTPTGEKLLVIVSNELMRAYGWCFSVDGKIPDLMPDQYYFENQNSKLSWFFAYSLYEKGQWTKYCVPAYSLPLQR